MVIFQRCKNAMQSGSGATEGWSFEFAHKVFCSTSILHSPVKCMFFSLVAQGHWSNQLMGYTSSSDPVGMLRLVFATKEAAVSFAEKQGLSYSVEEPQKKRSFVKSYEGNFKWKYVAGFSGDSLPAH